jgi:hypothetical protein
VETLCLKCRCFYRGALTACPRDGTEEVVSIDRDDPKFVRTLTDGPFADRVISRFDATTRKRFVAARERDGWYFTYIGGGALWVDVSLDGVGLFRFNPATREIHLYED